MPGIRKLKAVRATVRPDRRVEYLASWRRYARQATGAGAQVWLWEDQVLPGRFLELSEHEAAEGWRPPWRTPTAGRSFGDIAFDGRAMR